jgi:hypothetical protein
MYCRCALPRWSRISCVREAQRKEHIECLSQQHCVGNESSRSTCNLLLLGRYATIVLRSFQEAISPAQIISKHSSPPKDLPALGLLAVLDFSACREDSVH